MSVLTHMLKDLLTYLLTYLLTLINVRRYVLSVLLSRVFADLCRLWTLFSSSWILLLVTYVHFRYIEHALKCFFDTVKSHCGSDAAAFLAKYTTKINDRYLDFYACDIGKYKQSAPT